MKNAIRPVTIFVAGLLFISSGCHKGPVSKDEVETVVSNLGSSWTGRRERAEARLMQTEPQIAWPALKVLFDLELSHSKPRARAAAIRIYAGTAKTNLPMPALVMMALQLDPDRSVRLEALKAVTEAGDPASREVLEEILGREEDAEVKAALQASLKQLDKQQVIYYRKQAWEARAVAERVGGIRGLSRVGGEEDVTFLADLFAAQAKDESLIGQEVVLAIGQIGGDEAKKFVRSKLTASDNFVRASAAAVESQLADPEAVDDLATLLVDDRIGDIRVSASRALVAIGTPEARTALESGCASEQPDMVVHACTIAKKKLTAAKMD